uniref:Uncharacterized protein n=1 Tax=Populus trichocarpa TaxID=3694 RepID=B9GVF8_POPTR
MAQMLLLWWSKTTTKTGGVDTIATTSKTVENIGSTQNCFCGCLTKLLKKLKKRGRVIRAAAASRQSSFQCRYDPLSYSLNFDTSGHDEDYYHFCAFTSSWVVVPKITAQEDAMIRDDATGICDHSHRSMVKSLKVSFLVS